MSKIKLSPKTVKAIRQLKRVGHRSTEYIADKLNLSENTVKQVK